MECDIEWEVHPSVRARTTTRPPLTVPVQIGQKVVTALSDTGSSVSMMQAHLIPDGCPTLTAVAVVNRQVWHWPMVRMILGYDG